MKTAPTAESETATEKIADQKPNRATKLLAGAFFTRGLWSPFIGWITLAGCPFRLGAIEWGVDRRILKRELNRAFLWGVALTAAEACTIYPFLHTNLSIFGALFVWLVLLQWLVFPYFAVRGLFKRLVIHQSEQVVSTPKTLVLAEMESSISDLGFLLREAVFSVDSTKKIEAFQTRDDTPQSDPLSANAFYREIERAFSENSNGISTRRVEVVSAKEIRLSITEWKRWMSGMADVAKPGLACSERLLILGEHPQSDTLAVVEFAVHEVKPHLSFRIRLRWLPGFKRRLRHLDLLVREKLWWRGIFVPIMLAIVVVGVWILGGIIASTMTPTPTKGISFGEILSAKTELPEGIANLSDLSPDNFSQVVFALLFSKGGMTPFVMLVSVVAFHVPVLMLIVFLLRCGRFVKGLFYSATGTHLFIGSQPCLRFRMTNSGIGDEASLQTAASYLQIIEQVVTNRTVDVLRSFGINTDSIREELRLFVNEGIYMTGGEFRASNIIVGKKGVLGAKRRRNAKTGRQAVLGRTASK